MSGPDRKRSRTHGLSSIELMVATCIGAFIMIAAINLLASAGGTYRTNSAVARLQENARYALGVIEPDIRLAGFWGLGARGHEIENRASAKDPVSLLSPPGDCGPNWTLDLERSITGSNDTYDLACPAYGLPVAADVLVVRRASARPVEQLEAGGIYLRAARGGAATLFEGPDYPTGTAVTGAQIHELVVSAYYVSANSTLDTSASKVPSLRRKFLRHSNGDAAIADEEVLPGVEDLQVEFGVQRSGTSDKTALGVETYVTPGSSLLDSTWSAAGPDASILSVRVWLRLRGEKPELGLPADTGFSYAGKIIAPFNDGFRRIVISKTIFLRNAPRTR